SNSQLGGDAASVTSNSLMCPRHFFFYASGANGALHSFPTRRSSDLGWPRTSRGRAGRRGRAAVAAAGSRGSRGPVPGRAGPWPSLAGSGRGSGGPIMGRGPRPHKEITAGRSGTDKNVAGIFRRDGKPTARRFPPCGDRHFLSPPPLRGRVRVGVTAFTPHPNPPP